jgi:hypothetical protein
VGSREAMAHFRRQLEKRFEIKTKVVGTGKEEDREGKVLNRVIRVTEDGWEYEPDQRHAEMIVEELGLQGAKPSVTPGEDEKKWEQEENEVPLEKDRASKFRSIAARINYLAADRPDLMYSAKEACRQMANPTEGGWKMVKRIGRYLVGRPRAVLKYEWQSRESPCMGFSDSDWAGCRKTAKSTSGGVIVRGTHFLKGWSRTQQCITLSSAEAELVAMCKLAAELIGVLSMLKDLGEIQTGTVLADSTAALAIADRKGSGKLRHINISLLWIQEKESKEELAFEKVLGTENPADMMTKNLDSVKVQKFTSMLQQVFREGRSSQGLKMQRSGGADRGVIATVEQIAATADESRIEGRAEMSRQPPMTSKQESERASTSKEDKERRKPKHPKWPERTCGGC